MADQIFIALSSRSKDITGQKFGKLTVCGPVSVAKNGDALWLCRCQCGGKITDRAYNLRRYTGCGCDQQKSGLRTLSHGHYRNGIGSQTYNSWNAMKSRCTNPNHHKYERYGAVGVIVCQRWMESFEAFLSDMGERPEGKTLDRYPNPYGNYEPGNCRWATPLEQRHNRRKAKT